MFFELDANFDVRRVKARRPCRGGGWEHIEEDRIWQGRTALRSEFALTYVEYETRDDECCCVIASGLLGTASPMYLPARLCPWLHAFALCFVVVVITLYVTFGGVCSYTQAHRLMQGKSADPLPSPDGGPRKGTKRAAAIRELKSAVSYTHLTLPTKRIV